MNQSMNQGNNPVDSQPINQSIKLIVLSLEPIRGSKKQKYAMPGHLYVVQVCGFYHTQVAETALSIHPCDV